MQLPPNRPENTNRFHPKWRPLAALLMFGLCAELRSANVVDLFPLSDDMIVLHVSDGNVTLHASGERLDADKISVRPLIASALDRKGFKISSDDDPAYKTTALPLRMGRKSKGTDFANLPGTWEPSFGQRMAQPYYAAEHWIYLQLPFRLKSGCSYTLTWDKKKLGITKGTAILRFSDRSNRSEAIHVNQVGYAPAAPAKYGYLYHWAGDLGGVDYSAFAGRPFHIVDDQTALSVFEGKIAFRKPVSNRETSQPDDTPNFLGAAVWECDFSKFTTPGRYRLVVDGLGCSFSFVIAADAYHAAFQAVMKGLYQNRSGIALALPWASKVRPAPHNPKLTPGFAHRLFYSTFRTCDLSTYDGSAQDKGPIEAGRKGNLTETWGWYQDAGDWDGYLSHFEVPHGLLALWFTNPRKFTDGELQIPESGNGVPDLLDEAAWLPRYFHRLRHELLAKGWGTGGVGARVFGDLWGADQPDDIGRGSWQDTDRDWYVLGEDPFSTYHYAAAAAQLAQALKILSLADPEGVDWTREAIEAYAWAQEHTLRCDETGEANGPLWQVRGFAAAALYQLTGDAPYHDQLRKDFSVLRNDTRLEGTLLWAASLYLRLPTERPRDNQLTSTLYMALRNAAASYADTAEQRGCRWGGDIGMPMILGQATTPLINPLVLAHGIVRTAEPLVAEKLLRAAYTTADYFLGANPLNMTWVTGLAACRALVADIFQ